MGAHLLTRGIPAMIPVLRLQQQKASCLSKGSQCNDLDRGNHDSLGAQSHGGLGGGQEGVGRG